MPEADRALLSKSELFRGVREQDVDALLDRFALRELASGEEVYRQGETTDAELYVLLAGRIAITRRTDSGRGRSELIGPGEVFGELSVLDPGPRERTASAMVESSCAVLAGADYLGWALPRQYVAERLLRVLARRLRRTDDEALDLLFVDVGARLAKALCDLANRFGQPTSSGVLVDHGLSQQQLAEMVGTSRETLNKQLNSFANRGWLTSGRGLLVIRNPERLARRAAISEA
ncbi:MAG TPA: Crp/Fnr family transcriptional regulator [Mycobacteriales bacterium]|nr:Crp/Fnr family transcriptional regulator [Mycobacteriales bacterium]